METHELRCGENGIRIDAWIPTAIDGLSRSRARKLIEDGFVTVGGKPAKAGLKLREGDLVRVSVPEPEPSAIAAEDIDLVVRYEDPDLLVIDKPAGMVVHPAAGNRSGTLVNALLGKYGDALSDINGVIRPGIVHRIDRDTSGLLVVARNNAAHAALSAMLKDHEIRRTYVALCEGDIEAPSGLIDAPIGRSPADRKKMAVVPDGGRPARTHFKVLRRLRGATLAEVSLETGRTHQIRVHMAYIGHPVVGDPLYGRKKAHPGLETRGQALHATRLEFAHPRTGQPMRFESPLPPDFERTVAYFT